MIPLCSTPNLYFSRGVLNLIINLFQPRDAGLDPRYLGLINGILERLDRLEVASSSSNGSPARSFESQTNGSLRQTSSPNSDISGLDVDAEMSDDGLEMTDASTFEMNTDNHDYFLEHNRKWELIRPHGNISSC